MSSLLNPMKLPELGLNRFFRLLSLRIPIISQPYTGQIQAFTPWDTKGVKSISSAKICLIFFGGDFIFQDGHRIFSRLPKSPHPSVNLHFLESQPPLFVKLVSGQSLIFYQSLYRRDREIQILRQFLNIQ